MFALEAEKEVRGGRPDLATIYLDKVELSSEFEWVGGGCLGGWWVLGWGGVWVGGWVGVWVYFSFYRLLYHLQHLADPCQSVRRFTHHTFRFSPFLVGWPNFSPNFPIWDFWMKWITVWWMKVVWYISKYHQVYFQKLYFWERVDRIKNSFDPNHLAQRGLGPFQHFAKVNSIFCIVYCDIASI